MIIQLNRLAGKRFGTVKSKKGRRQVSTHGQAQETRLGKYREGVLVVAKLESGI